MRAIIAAVADLLRAGRVPIARERVIVNLDTTGSIAHHNNSNWRSHRSEEFFVLRLEELTGTFTRPAGLVRLVWVRQGCIGGAHRCAPEIKEMEGTMTYKLVCASCMMAAAVIGAAPAYANPVGHGNMCGSPASANPATEAPGNSATSPGSTHN